jgi:hypothetical protein
MHKQVLGFALLFAAVLPVLADEPVTLPPAVAAQMKGGKKLGKVWLSPKFDVTKGFTVGKVDCLVNDYYSDVVQYFPSALRSLVMEGSPNVLDLSVVELKVVTRSAAGYETATMGVEGKVSGPDGELLMAFTTREEIANRENARADCMGAMDKVIYSLSKELGPTFQKALKAYHAMGQGQLLSSQLPPPPPPEKPLSTNERLLRLEDLKRKGIITQEEYEAKKKEILATL